MSEDGYRKQKKIKIKSPRVINKGFNLRWVLFTVVLTFFLSVSMGFATTLILPDVSFWAAFVILLFVILIGILFDIIGIAVTSATEQPFHSMASKKIKGAQNAIFLIRNAEKVSNVCNDVVGDICGIISGAAGAIVVTELVITYNFNIIWVSLLTTGIIAALTVGGKAAGKSFAISRCNFIVYFAGRLCFFKSYKKKRRKEKKNGKNTA